MIIYCDYIFSKAICTTVCTLYYTSAAIIPGLVVYFILGVKSFHCSRFSAKRKRECTYLVVLYFLPFPYAPAREYLPTFSLKITQMLVNIPYMEHMGLFHTSGGELL